MSLRGGHRVASKTLTEKIEALPPEKRAQVEEFVDSVASDLRQRTPVVSSDLLRRMDDRRERLRREVGLFDSVAAICELRDE
jgi:hypothetical protein